MSALHVDWTGGGTASLESIDDDKVELLSTRAFAPGSRPEGAITPGGTVIWLKVHGSRREPGGAFRVKGRLLNVRREVLGHLKGVVHGSNGGKSSTS